MRTRTSFRIAAVLLSFSLIALYVMYYSRTGVFADERPREEKPVISSSKYIVLEGGAAPATQEAQASKRTMLILGSKAPASVVYPGETVNLELPPSASMPETTKRSMVMGGSKSAVMIDPRQLETIQNAPATLPTTRPVTPTTRKMIMGGSKSKEIARPDLLNRSPEQK